LPTAALQTLNELNLQQRMVGASSVASVVAQQGPCDVNCVKAASAFQGADALVESTNLKYWMDIRYSAAEDAGEACGFTHQFAAVSPFFVNPSAPTKVSTAETREEPVVTFQCTAGKSYHLIMQDSLAGAIQNKVGYTHWVKLNMGCSSSTLTGTTVNDGTDINQGSTTGYAPMAFPYAQFNHFHFVLFETDKAFSATEIASFDQYLSVANKLDGTAPTMPAHMQQLGLELPVARSWIDVTTSFWSKVKIDRLFGGRTIPGFSDIQCKCNKYGAGADPQCTVTGADEPLPSL